MPLSHLLHIEELLLKILAMRFYLLLLWLSFPLLLQAEAFVIENYQLDMQVQRNGSIEVRERITVNFSQARQGIFRMLPYRYILPTSLDKLEEQSEFIPTDGTHRFLLYENLEVLGDEVNRSEEGDFIKLRIGTAGEYHEGLKTYEIRYTLWGAVKHFEDHQELALDLIGTKWPTAIEKVDVTIRLEAAPRLRSEYIQLRGGYTGSRDSTVGSYSYSGGRLAVQNNRPLKANEGLSLFLKLPQNYFKRQRIPVEKFTIDCYTPFVKIDAQLLEDGSLLVNETWEIRNRTESIESLAALNAYNRRRQYEDFTVIVEQFEASWQDVGGEEKKIREGYNIFAAGASKNGTLRRRYKLWGTALHEKFNWKVPMFQKGKPIEKLELHLSYPKNWNISKEYWSVDRSFQLEQMPGQLKLSNRYRLGAWKSDALVIENTKLQPGWLSMGSIPIEVFAEDYYVKTARVDLRLDEQGRMHLEQRQQVHFVEERSYRTKDFGNFIEHSRFKRGPYQSSLYLNSPEGNPFKEAYHWLVSDIRASSNEVDQVSKQGTRYFVDWDEPYEEVSYDLSYNTYGLWRKEEGKALFAYPIFHARRVTDGVKLNLDLPEGWEQGEFHLYYVKSSFSNDELKYEAPLEVSDNKLEIELDRLLLDRETLYLHIALPADLVGSEWGSELLLLWENYFFFILPVLLAVLLTVLWLLFGRDKWNPLVVEYLPPDDVSPAEAGFLWDGKLHDRDLVALIYYWAGRGYLRIEEKEEKLTLHRIKKLPTSAHSFEKTLFEGLFGSREKVSISSLRASFYKKMRKARKQLHDYSVQKRLFVPGSLGFSKILRTSAIGIGIYGIISYIVPFQWTDTENRIDVILGTLFCLILLYAFARIMPRYGHLGKERFERLRGFREFIKRCEQKRLEKLLDEQPNYFDTTISYAIVLGLGHVWAKKFEPLLKEPPAWYSGYDSKSFNSVAFTQHAIGQMYSMSKTFTSTPAPSGGSYSSSSSSWSSSSWSSSSSSSYSSGSSFSSGSSGSSGGGFGGGGGGSW